MVKHRPLISFCIPTYNRAPFLKASLESYVNNKAFDDDVEIVISDNASTDETQSVGEYYACHYPNVHYFKNDENIRDANFPLALDRASAYYIKLMNDNMPLSENGLLYIKTKIRDYIEKRPPLFFIGRRLGGFKNDDVVYCKHFEDFVVNMSRWVTGIAQFGAWKEQWERVKNPTKYSILQLSQDDWSYQIVENEGKAILLTGSYYSKKLLLPKKGGYNWFKVQVDNYYTILKPYIDKGLLSKNALKKEKKSFLRSVMPWIGQVYWMPVFPNWEFETAGTSKILWRHFKGIPYFYFIMITIPLWGTLLSLKNIIQSFK